LYTCLQLPDVTRGTGTVELVQGLLPDWSAVGFALLTQLGDPWFLVALLAVLYWRVPSQRSDFVLVGGMYLVAVGLYRSIKQLTALPRPDRPLLDPAAVPELLRPLYETTAFAGGYGFPSGHATGSAAVYLGLAAVLTIGSRRRRLGAAAVLVAAIGFSRIALGLHYLVDVLAGFALGGGIVAAAVVGDRRFGPGPVLAAAVASTAINLAIGGITSKSVLAVAAAVGLAVGWRAGRQ
jgi:membrane-associated phospholipid phosphatase